MPCEPVTPHTAWRITIAGRITPRAATAFRQDTAFGRDYYALKSHYGPAEPALSASSRLLRGEISSCAGAASRGGVRKHVRGDVARRHGSATRLGAGPSRAGPVRTPCAESPPPSCVRFQCVIKSRPWPEAPSPHASSPRQSDRVGRKGETSRPTLRTGKRHTSGIGAREAEIAKATLPIGFCSHRGRKDYRGRKDSLRSLRPLCVLGVKTSRIPFFNAKFAKNSDAKFAKSLRPLRPLWHKMPCLVAESID